LSKSRSALSNDAYHAARRLDEVRDREIRRSLITIIWTAELETRLFFNLNPENIADAFRNDDFITIRITRFF